MAAIQFGISFVAVFMKGYQHQNVIGGNYWAAFCLSYLMAIGQVATLLLMVQVGWASVFPVGTGSALGLVLSMYLYRKWHS